MAPSQCLAQRVRDGFRHRILQRESVREFSVEPVRPKNRLVPALDQVLADANALAEPWTARAEPALSSVG